MKDGKVDSTLVRKALEGVQHDPSPILIKNLETWVKSIKGTDTVMTYIKEYIPGFRGIHALKNIFQGKTVIFMPLSTLITSDVMYNTPVG